MPVVPAHAVTAGRHRAPPTARQELRETVLAVVLCIVVAGLMAASYTLLIADLFASIF